MPTIFAEGFTNEDGIVFEPVSADNAIGYKITAPDGRVEYLLLNPTSVHDPNERGSLADTFLYRVDPEGARAWDAEQEGPGTGAALVDYGDALTFIDHFEADPAVTEKEPRA